MHAFLPDSHPVLPESSVGVLCSGAIRADTFTMMASRILGSVGRFLITSGIVVLLFVGYQLWGTGIQEASAQNSLGDDFDALLEQVETPTTAAPTTTAPATTTSVAESTTTTTTTTIPEAGGTIPVFDDDLADALYRQGGEAIARIVIPKISVSKVVVQGVQVEDLRNGPGHYRATVFPGQEGNSGIAGHRTTYGAPFNRIDELVPGDEVNVRTVQGFHRYRVLSAEEAYGPDVLPEGVGFTIPDGGEGLGHIIVGPEATWVLQDFGDNRITLTACHPKYSARQRIIVAAELVSVAVDAPPPPDDYDLEDEVLASEFGDDAEVTGLDADGNAIEDASQTVGEPADNAGRAVGSETPTAAAFADEVSLDEGLDGDKDALVPGILWGLAAIAAYIGFKELGRRWRRWPAIALGIVPVVILMGLSFEKIDRFLPAG